uniref:Proteasome assembly chaperone 4 n=1 Tax=Penicillium aethiopicum TaxID=36650 RepID=D7PI24_PENAE|nr:unknown [Penicillium aethiopicum]
MATEVPLAVPSAALATPSIKPQEISFTLPKALHTTAHVHLNFLGHCAMVFLATSSPGDSGGSVKPMGSFVYAMPDRTSSKSTISTTLYTSAPSIEYTNRIAKILARRFSIPVYVGCSIDPHSMGLEVAEEMEGLTKIVNVIMEKWEEHKQEKARSAE